jgi:dsDNA-specific endonuclease/ATPase MutS2
VFLEREIDNGLYLADLMVSFCRSHFIASDLILGGELVEAAVIVRKQMELLARLNELSAGLDIDKLVRRTPNIKHLKTSLNRLYSEYSEISHSASPKVMQILGRKELEEGIFRLLVKSSG